MTEIRCQFPTVPARPNMGLEGMRAAELTSLTVTFTVPREVQGHESRDEREAMYAALFAEV